jgi:hypothetical protein
MQLGAGVEGASEHHHVHSGFDVLVLVMIHTLVDVGVLFRSGMGLDTLLLDSLNPAAKDCTNASSC